MKKRRCRDCKWSNGVHSTIGGNRAYFCTAINHGIKPSGTFCREDDMASYSPKWYIRLKFWKQFPSAYYKFHKLVNNQEC